GSVRQGGQEGRPDGGAGRQAGRPHRAGERHGAKPPGDQGRGAGTEEQDRRDPRGNALMAALKAPVLGGKSAKDVSLDEAVFGVELKPHLVHEAVRAEANSHRQGTGAAKSRGLVSGGRAKPW